MVEDSSSSSHKRFTVDRIRSSSLPVESQICAEVLQHLATGTTPTHLLPSTPLNTTDDAEAYQTKSEIEHQRLLTAALSILLDSTSPGPDPIALESLGWAYGSGGMGDWDGCHYMPGSIGNTLRVLQDQVALQLTETSDASFKDYLDNEPWWLQDHEVEYEGGLERPATRFCTVGGLPPWDSPYTKGGLIWGPPLAGVCVPSSCTPRALYVLFDEGVGFADKLLELSSRDGIYDAVQPGDSPPTASRRFRYMNSLAQSFTAGRRSRSGIVCEGETGLPELDQEGYRSQGYYATIALVWVLFSFVVIGTITTSLSKSRDKKKSDQSLNSMKLSSSSQQNSNINTHKTSLMESPITTVDYGTNIMWRKSEPDLSVQASSTEQQTFLSKLGEEYTERHSNITNHDYDTLVNIEHEVNYDSAEQSSSDTCSSSTPKKNIAHTWFETIRSTFAVWDAGQSFYEITRLKREGPENAMHQKHLQEVGSVSLDPYNSTAGFFPTFEGSRRNLVYDSPRRRARRTISVSSSKCLNGMRSISMLWIIFGHTLAVQSSIGYFNPAAILPPTGMMSSMLGTLFLSARYAVDTFFFIGGYLVMSGILKRLDPSIGEELSINEEMKMDFWLNILAACGIVNPNHVVVGEYGNRLRKAGLEKRKKPRGLLWVFPFLIHRILRIIPTYGFVLLLWWKVAVTMGDGPFWPRWATFVAQCDANAWTNLLFINNLVPLEQPFGETSECMYHAWYLGVDFQLCAVLTPIFVSLFLRKGWRQVTIILEALLVLGIIVVSVISSFRNGWSAHLFDGANTVAFDRGFYINPFFRSSPYIIGFITAQIWHEKCRLCPNAGLTKITSVILSLLSISLLLFLTLGTGGCEKRPCLIWETPEASDCGSGWSRDTLAIYNSFVRPAWGFGLAIMSLLSFNGQLVSLGASSVLTWSGWDPIGKLSFSMYLLHPLIINIWVLGGASKFRYSHVNFFYAFAGIVCITFFSALVVGILVEWPMSKVTRNIEKRLWSSEDKEKERN